jgi:ribosomal protein L12E/L44/L45/RPP1/RPP2
MKLISSQDLEGGNVMAEEQEITPEMVRRMAAIRGIEVDPQRLEAVAKDLDVSVRKLAEVTKGALFEVEPAFIGPLRFPTANSAQRRQS